MNPILKTIVSTHVGLYRLSGGRVGSKIGKLPALLLTTKGRKSGKPRTVPLACFEDQGDALVVASFGGSPQHPAWFNNLSANPVVSVQRGADQYEARAEVVPGPERERLWQMVVNTAPGFAEYQKKTTREIPIVRLKRIGAS